MKDGDKTIIVYNLKVLTRPYFPSDKIAMRYRVVSVSPDSRLCDDPKIMFPVVYYTDPKWSEN